MCMAFNSLKPNSYTVQLNCGESESSQCLHFFSSIELCAAVQDLCTIYGFPIQPVIVAQKTARCFRESRKCMVTQEGMIRRLVDVCLCRLFTFHFS